MHPLWESWRGDCYNSRTSLDSYRPHTRVHIASNDALLDTEGPLPALSGVHFSIIHAYLRIYAKGSLLYPFSLCCRPPPLSLFLPPSPFFLTVVCIEMNTCVKRKQNSKRIMVYKISHPILEVKLLLGEFYRFFTEPCLKVTVLCYEFPLKVFQVYRS